MLFYSRNYVEETPGKRKIIRKWNYYSYKLKVVDT